LGMPVPLTKYLGVGWESDPSKKLLVERGKELGIVKDTSGVLHATQRDIPVFMENLKNDLTFTKQLNDTKLTTMQNRLNEIGTQLAEEGNPKTAEKLSQEKAVIEKTMSQLIKNSYDIDGYQKIEMEKIKREREPKSPTQIDIEIAASNGDPVAVKILKDQEDRKLRIAKINKSVTVNGLSTDENAALTRAIEEGRLDPNRINSRSAKLYAQLELSKPGQNFASLSADINANRGSIQWQQKNRDLMSSFVANIGKQNDRLAELTKTISLSDIRLLNLPLVEFRKRVSGDPKLSKVAMYLTEISNEAARLSSGNAASIAELSLGAQERWAKIHDPYLSIKDMLDLTKETYHAGVMRLETVDDTLAESRKRFSSKEKGKPSEGPTIIETRTLKDGTTWQKFSDGSYKQVK
jgi:uncharacterized protein YaaR (DUF327 family)